MFTFRAAVQRDRSPRRASDACSEICGAQPVASWSFVVAAANDTGISTGRSSDGSTTSSTWGANRVDAVDRRCRAAPRRVRRPRCRPRPRRPSVASRRYARTTSRTSLKSRRVDKSPTTISPSPRSRASREPAHQCRHHEVGGLTGTEMVERPSDDDALATKTHRVARDVAPPRPCWRSRDSRAPRETSRAAADPLRSRCRRPRTSSPRSSSSHGTASKAASSTLWVPTTFTRVNSLALSHDSPTCVRAAR